MFLRRAIRRHALIGRPAPSPRGTRLNSTRSSTVPWFMDGEDDFHSNHMASKENNPISLPPSDAPPHLHLLHSHLITLPILEPHTVQVRRPPPRESEPLPYRKPQGRRKRGGTYFGEGIGEPPDIWDWIVVAQVKEGTEGKGAIEAVVKSARKVLSTSYPHLALPSKTALSRQTGDGWGFMDVGDAAIHILSCDAMEKWFSDNVLNEDDSEYEQIPRGGNTIYH